MMNMVYRVNKVLSMAMGEVDMSIFDDPDENSTFNFWEREFWEEVPLSGHLIYTTFCLTVPMLILNILTAFTIKVWVILTLSKSAVMLLSQDVEKVLRDAEINKLKTQADYVSIVEKSFLSK